MARKYIDGSSVLVPRGKPVAKKTEYETEVEVRHNRARERLYLNREQSLLFFVFFFNRRGKKHE
jgi:hypothetical protein